VPQATAGSRGPRWVCLDVGETLIDETRVWTVWAEVLGMTPLTLMAGLGAAIVVGDHGNVATILKRPDWRRLEPAFEERYGGFRNEDLYPDVMTALEGLRSADYRLAVVANQPARRTAELRQLGVDAEMMAMSEELGVHKPDPAFFSRTLGLLGDPDPGTVAYVGDRLDNDVRPAAAAGMRAVWLRRGPWAALTTDRAADGTLVVDSLAELVERIGEVL